MKKDIEFPEVENVAVAVVYEAKEEEDAGWNVYILNLRDEKLENVLVTSSGYGEINGEQRRTSKLRYLIEELPSKEFAFIEPIVEEVLGLSNEYWISFYIGGKVYDKRYVFVPESISDANTTMLPLIKQRGVMIR